MIGSQLWCLLVVGRQTEPQLQLDEHHFHWKCSLTLHMLHRQKTALKHFNLTAENTTCMEPISGADIKSYGLLQKYKFSLMHIWLLSMKNPLMLAVVWNLYQQVTAIYVLSKLHGKSSKHKYLYIICTMLAQRQRRWSDVVQMLCKCFVFAGKVMS